MEGAPSRGFRQRLYARVLVLEDGSGEQLTIVVADLQAISPNLHREVARRAGIDYTTLLFSATHTHAAPSHYNAEQSFNENSSQVAGYDTVMVNFLAGRIARAVTNAGDPDSLRPARVAWGTADITGVSRNRSYEPYLANRGVVPPGFPAGSETAVENTWTMLRVDIRDADSGEYTPAGAFSIFGIHPTVIPAVNELYDADIHGYVNRRLEVFLDSIAGIAAASSSDDPRPNSVHLWATGAEGDVSPTWRDITRCRPPKLRRGFRPAGARAPRPPDHWEAVSPSEAERCLSEARRDMARIGDRIVLEARDLYDRLGRQLSDDVTLGRAFETIDLYGYVTASGSRLPASPMVGTAMLGGAEEAHMRFYGERPLFVLSSGFVEGGAALNPDNPDTLQRPKRKPPALLYSAILNDDKLPRSTQLMVARVGEMFLAAVPAEVTTVASYRLRQALHRAATAAGQNDPATALIGLANGYILYLTTPEEYMLQHYEGGATLFGHQTLPVLEEEYGKLAASLFSQPTVLLGPIIQRPSPSTSIFPVPDGEYPEERAISKTTCGQAYVSVRWNDAPPDSLIPASSLLLELKHTSPSGAVSRFWDDDPRVEVRALGGDRWEARFYLDHTTGSYEFRLRPRKKADGRMVEAVTAAFACN
jgi:neutral ceramidase